MTTRNALRLGYSAVALIAAAACSVDSAKKADTAAVAGADTALSTPAPSAATPQAAPAPAPAKPGSDASAGAIDPNSATIADLTAIPGVTEPMATAIVAGRPYGSMVAVNAILAKSLSKPQRDSVYTRLWIPIDLNKASDAEILLIPGVGPRMLHEFKEYRPWTAIEQFRREIGTYVDKQEVARLEKYVSIK